MASSPNRPSSPNALTGGPKDHRRPLSPPPAYFPRPRPPFLSTPYLAARLAQQVSSAAAAAASHPLAQPGWQDIDDLSDGDGDRSAITVRISTAVRVTGDHNVMCLAADPAATARFVAEAVTRVLRGGGAEARGGIPMIDEEGRPRPLRIEIEAGTDVRGEGNVVGGEAVVMRALGKRRRGLDGCNDDGDGDDDDEEMGVEEGEEEEEKEEARRRRRRMRHASV